MTNKYTGKTEKYAFDIAVVGAGASGCMAALTAAQSGASVLLIEHNDKIGRKIYATGNGRCNLTNLSLSAAGYHSVSAGLSDDDPAIERVSSILSQFSIGDMMGFFESRGIYLHDRKGYVYPRTDQAETIVRFLENELYRQKVSIKLSENVTAIDCKNHQFFINCSGKIRYTAHRLILCGGGMAGPQYGCDGSNYNFASKFGHSTTSLYPALVPLSGDPAILRYAAGVRCDASISIEAGKQGHFTVIDTERGELQLLKDSISGIPVFQLSKYVGKLLDEKYTVHAVIDFLPEFEEHKWVSEKNRRLSADRNCMLGDYFNGLVNRKVLDMILTNRSLQAEKKASKLTDELILTLMDDLRKFEISIRDTGTYKQAQVTAGGIPLTELSGDLESKKVTGLYFAGEVIDVDGICGGYNLQFAFATGYIAGKSAGRKDSHA